MSNLSAKMTQTSIEMKGKLHFSKIWNGETSLNFTYYLKYEKEYFSDENIQKITLFIIYSFIEFFIEVLVSIPKVSMVHLTMRIHCNWPTYHATDHISIELNRLTIQLVFSEV